MAKLASSAPDPVYVKATKDRYVSLKDTGALMRANLARSFPGVKFYVRSSSYSGGSSITVYYDGLDHYAALSSCYCSDGPVPDLPHTPNRCVRCGYYGRMDPVYKDGMPSLDDVNAVVGPFASSGFDGMIDMAFSKNAWINPDGSVAYGASDGTVGSMGSHDGYRNARPSPGAVMVHFGVSYVSVNHDLPYDVRSKNGGAA